LLSQKTFHVIFEKKKSSLLTSLLKQQNMTFIE